MPALNHLAVPRAGEWYHASNLVQCPKFVHLVTRSWVLYCESTRGMAANSQWMRGCVIGAKVVARNTLETLGIFVRVSRLYNAATLAFYVSSYEC